MACGHNRAEEHAAQRPAESAREDDRCDAQGDHGWPRRTATGFRVFFARAGLLSVSPLEGVADCSARRDPGRSSAAISEAALTDRRIVMRAASATAGAQRRRAVPPPATATSPSGGRACPRPVAFHDPSPPCAVPPYAPLAFQEPPPPDAVPPRQPVAFHDPPPPEALPPRQPWALHELRLPSAWPQPPAWKKAAAGAHESATVRAAMTPVRLVRMVRPFVVISPTPWLPGRSGAAGSGRDARTRCASHLRRAPR